MMSGRCLAFGMDLARRNDLGDGEVGQVGQIEIFLRTREEIG